MKLDLSFFSDAELTALEKGDLTKITDINLGYMEIRAKADTAGAGKDRGTWDAVKAGFAVPFADLEAGADKTFYEQPKTGFSKAELAQMSARQRVTGVSEDHPIASTVGQIGGVLGIAAPAVVARLVTAPETILAGLGTSLAVAGPGAYAQSLGARSSELMGGDPTKRAEATQAAQAGAGVDTAIMVTPFGASVRGAPIVTQALQRAVTGAVINPASGAAGDYAQNLAAPKSMQVDPLSWDRRKMEVLTGGILGPVFGSSMGRGDKASAPSRSPSSSFSREQLEAQAIDTAQINSLNNISRDKESLVKLERRAADPSETAENLAQIQERTTATKERIASEQQKLDYNEVAYAKATTDYGLPSSDMRTRLENYVKLTRDSGAAEHVQLRAVRALEEYNSISATKGDPLEAAQGGAGSPPVVLNPVGDTLGTPSPTISPEISTTGSTPTGQRYAPLVLEGKTEMELLQAIQSKQTKIEAEIKTGNRPEFVEMLKAEIEQIKSYLTKSTTSDMPGATSSMGAPAHLPQPVLVGNIRVSNGTPDQIKLVERIATKLSLLKENIGIDLAGTGHGRVRVTDDGYDVSIPPPTKSIWFNENWNQLTKADVAKFEFAWKLAHEFGHILLNKFLRNDAFDSRMTLLFDDYTKWLQKTHPDVARAYANVIPSVRDAVKEINSPDYMLNFPEFFAQRVARELMRDTDSPIGRFVKSLGDLWGLVRKEVGLPLPTRVAVDDVVRSIINRDPRAIANLGEDLWHVINVNQVRTPLEAALRQNALFGKPVWDKAKYPSISNKDAADIGIDYIPSLGENLRTDAKTAEEAVAGLQGKGPLPPIPMSLNSLGALVTPLNQTAQLTGNPVVKYAATKIANALNKYQALRIDVLMGKGVGVVPRGMLTSVKRVANKASFHVLEKQASNKDFHTILGVFQRGEGRLDYEASLRQYGQHLTEKQAALYKATAKVFSDIEEAMFTRQSETGNRLTPHKVGYLPHQRPGEFTVVLQGDVRFARAMTLDAEGNRVLDTTLDKHVERFFTQREAVAFVNKYNQEHAPQTGLSAKFVGKSTPVKSMYELEDATSKLDAAKSQGAPKSVIDALQTQIEELTQNSSIGGHHKGQMTQLLGYKGTELFRKNDELGLSFREAIPAYVKEISDTMQRGDIRTMLDELLMNPAIKEGETNSNLRDFLEGFKDHHVGNGIESPMAAKKLLTAFDSLVHAIISNTVNPNYHVKDHVVSAALGKTSQAFYWSLLTTRPTLWAAQAVTFVTTLRTLTRNQGVLSAFKDMAVGFGKLNSNDKEFFAYVNWATRNVSTLHPEFVHDVSKGGFDLTSHKIFGYLSGETPMAASDSFSRLISASFMFEHFKQKGLTGEQLYRAVSQAVDADMVLYSQAHKAPMFKKLGVVGDLVSPLSTFPQAQLANFAADIAHLKRSKAELGAYQAALPLMSTFLVSIALGGVLGGVGVAEVALLVHLYNYLQETLGGEDRMSTPYELVLGSPTSWASGGEFQNETIDRIISHGIPSASTLAFSKEGYDIGSSNRWRPIFADIVTGEKNWASMVPVIPWAAGVASSTVNLVKNERITEGEARDARKKIIPGSYFGVYEALRKDSFGKGVIPDKNNAPKFEKSFDKAIAPILGTKTVDESKYLLKERLQKQEDMKVRAKVSTIMNNLALNGLSQEKAASELKLLIDTYHKKPQEIFTTMFGKKMKSLQAGSNFPGGKATMSIETLIGAMQKEIEWGGSEFNTNNQQQGQEQ